MKAIADQIRAWARERYPGNTGIQKPFEILAKHFETLHPGMPEDLAELQRLDKLIAPEPLRCEEARMSKPNAPLWFVLDCDGMTFAEVYDELTARYLVAARNTLPRMLSYFGDNPDILTSIERKAIDDLITLAGATYNLADNTQDHTIVEPVDFIKVSDALDALDDLPDDQPGYTMGPAAKAAWALRRLIGHDQ